MMLKYILDCSSRKLSIQTFNSTAPSCNPDQLQHYLASFNPVASNLAAFNLVVSSPAVNNLRLPHLKRSSSKLITRACPCTTSLCTWGANVEDCFFGPRGVTSLATHATSTYYGFFWVNLFKAQNKLISHLTTWIGLTWPVRSLLQEADSWSNFLFINWDHNP